LDKLSEIEYANLADELAFRARRGLLELSDYHAQLIELASRRASADSKPEVLIQKVRFEKYGDAEIARGYALNHPRLGAAPVRTSLVVSKADDGSSFETLNTRYIIVQKPEVGDKEVETGPDFAVTVEVLNSKIPLSKIL
jgi:hypothetical protein